MEFQNTFRRPATQVHTNVVAYHQFTEWLTTAADLPLLKFVDEVHFDPRGKTFAPKPQSY